MCFDLDSRPPIPPIAGGALDSGLVTLTADDGNQLTAFRARALEPGGAGVVILPDVRGLHPYYEDLALRFAEHGIEAVAIDYFGRTAGLGRRDTGFEFMPHVEQATWDGLAADVRAGNAYLASAGGGAPGSRFTVGFCFGGRLAFLSATLGLGFAGVIGFYGNPVGPGRAGTPAPADLADRVASPVLGLFGGDDPGIPATAVATFEAALRIAGVDERLVIYDGAPHSFFDRKADEFARTSAAAWDEVRAFVRANTATHAPGA
jgi:carboxymethylenebutenolidase